MLRAVLLLLLLSKRTAVSNIHPHHHISLQFLGISVSIEPVPHIKPLVLPDLCLVQGVSEAVLGGMTALSALVGAVSTRLFPLLFRRLGLTSTGLLGFTLQSSCLVLCVASVWAPGSPFSLTTNEDSQPQEDNSLVSVIMLLTGDFESTEGNFTDPPSQASSPAGLGCGWQTSLSIRYSRRSLLRSTEVTTQTGSQSKIITTLVTMKVLFVECRLDFRV